MLYIFMAYMPVLFVARGCHLELKVEEALKDIFCPISIWINADNIWTYLAGVCVCVCVCVNPLCHL
jgi:hypothetical protein